MLLALDSEDEDLNRRRTMARQSGPFDPRQVPEVAAGYFWDPASITGSGTAGFSMPEAGGKSTYNMVAAAAGTAPSSSTINGQPVLQVNDATPDQLCRTNATVTRGFTGAVMIWGWIHAQTTNTGTVFGQARTAGNVFLQLNTADVRVIWNDNAGAKEARFPLPSGGYAAGPFYYEAILRPTLDAEVWYNRVQQTPTIAGTMGATLNDAAEFFHFSGGASDSSNFNISGAFAFGVGGITSGIPSDANRDLMFGHRRLK